MKLYMIAAIGINGEIGKDNDLLWHLPTDMQFFKDQTKHKVVIMGRKNYDSIPPKYRPLPNRTNIIITRNEDLEAPECYVCTSLQDSIELCKELGEEEIFIIGGAQIYDLALQTLPIDTMYITHVDAAFPDAHAVFPSFNVEEWNASILSEHPKDEAHAYSFVIKQYDRI